MAVNITKTEHFTSGAGNPISFSQIRTEFGGSATNIKASTYLRNDDSEVDWDDESTITSRIPDATENADVESVSNWTVDSLRDTITSYLVTQSGSDEELSYSDSNTDTWNNNLSKNVPKTFDVTGTVYADDASKDALSFIGNLYNLEIEVDENGEILGQGGESGIPGEAASSVRQDTVEVTTTSTTYKRVQIRRYYNPTTGDHFVTTGSPPAGYNDEGGLCRIFTSQAPGTISIRDYNGPGFPDSGSMGYAYPGYGSQPANTTPIYALDNGSETLWSLSNNEGSSSGYTYLRTEFYAPKQDLTVTTETTTIVPGELEYSPSTEPGDGGNGGDALYVNNINTKSNVEIRSYGKIWAGGGGGSGGTAGNAGSDLTCSGSNEVTRNVSHVGQTGSGNSACRSGETEVSRNPNGVRNRCRGGGTRRGSGWNSTNKTGYHCGNGSTSVCKSNFTYTTTGGVGGTGGAGGSGRGYSYQNESLEGGSGNPGTSNSCSGSTSTGNPGGDGKPGGEWGQSPASGGVAGRAVLKKNAKVTYYTDDTLKGLIQDI